MKFDGVEVFLRMFQGSNGIVGPSSDLKSAGKSHHVVSMAIPDFRARRNAGIQFRAAFDVQVRGAVLTAEGTLHFPTKRVGEPMHAVTDTEDRNAKLENVRVALRRIRVVNRAWAAGEDHTNGFEGADFFERGSARQNRGEHFLLADAARDQLRVLAAEIEDDNSVSRAHGASRRIGWCGFRCCLHCRGSRFKRHLVSQFLSKGARSRLPVWFSAVRYLLIFS